MPPNYVAMCTTAEAAASTYLPLTLNFQPTQGKLSVTVVSSLLDSITTCLFVCAQGGWSLPQLSRAGQPGEGKGGLHTVPCHAQDHTQV